MAPDRDAVGRPSSGATTPPSAEMGTPAEEQELVVGSEYWVVDETGAEVWSLVEVLELCDGHVVANLVDCGKRKEIDLVSGERNDKKAQHRSSKPATDLLCVFAVNPWSPTSCVVPPRAFNHVGSSCAIQ